MTKSAVARGNMIAGQIRPNKVTDDRVVAAMRTVPRELFVPGALASVAYADDHAEIAPGRFIMAPMVLARLIQAADIGPGDIVLEVGCGTGYATAVLAQLADTVVALEEDEALAERAVQTLGKLEVANAAVVTGPLRDGLASEGPYDVIVMGGAIGELPEVIGDQLADGGRLLGVMNFNRVGKAMLYRRAGKTLGRRELFDAAVPSLPGFAGTAGFSF